MNFASSGDLTQGVSASLLKTLPEMLITLAFDGWKDRNMRRLIK